MTAVYRTGDQDPREVFIPSSKAAPHIYLSTACLHREHGYCQSKSGPTLKVPAKCKFCASRCICSCHAATPEETPTHD